MMTRHFAAAALAAGLATTPAAAFAQHNHAATPMDHGSMQHPAEHTVTVYRTRACGCCGKWAEHLRQAGYPVKVVDVADVTPTKVRYGVPTQLRTCHTAIVAGYVIEGHVPADVIHKLLTEQPKHIKGIAVAGMPQGSPGMETGGQRDHYDVIAFDAQGKTTVYARR